MNIVVDTSVIIEHLRSAKGPLTQLFNLQASQEASLLLPTIAIAEIWTGKSLDNPKVEKQVIRILNNFISVPLSPQIAMTAGLLVRHQHSHSYDSIIAATALVNQAQLATQNTKHFASVPQLQLWQPS